MKVLKKIDISAVSGGEIIAGNPSTDMVCMNVKLMIAAARGQAGFDIGVAALALTKVDPTDFGSADVALEFVRSGNIALPVAPITPEV